MRIRLKNGKQKEIILLSKGMLPWDNLSKKLNINRGYLSNELKNEKMLLSDNLYRGLCKISNKNFDMFIIERLKDNWGRSKGGSNSSGSLIKLKSPQKDEKLSEFVGSVLGDGNINYYKKGKKVGVYSIRITGDKQKDEHYHSVYLKNLIKDIFNLEGRIITVKNKNERSINVYSKQLVMFFINMGINQGDKIRNKSTIPKWIFSKKKFLRSCIRGLMDTDGSIFRMSNKDQNLIRISFTNHNSKLLEDTRKGLIVLGFYPSKIIMNRQFFISRQEDIKKYLKEVGFSNKKHLKRIKIFNSPVVQRSN